MNVLGENKGEDDINKDCPVARHRQTLSWAGGQDLRVVIGVPGCSQRPLVQQGCTGPFGPASLATAAIQQQCAGRSTVSSRLSGPPPSCNSVPHDSSLCNLLLPTHPRPFASSPMR